MITNLIIGCGGVGSNLAYFLSRDENTAKVTLVDFDIVEEKNLKRQLFTTLDIGKTKVQALKESLEQLNPKIRINALNTKIINNQDIQSCIALAEMDENNEINEMNIYVCTDNEQSKDMISKYFEITPFKYGTNRLFIGCDKGIVKIEGEFQKQKIWSIGDGYTSEQDFMSNLLAATYSYLLMKELNVGYSLFEPLIIEENKLIELISRRELCFPRHEVETND